MLIDGDLRNNCILFRFLFDKEEMVHPLIVSVKAMPITSLNINLEMDKDQDGAAFIYPCNIPDYNNPLMKTDLICPDFSLKDHCINVINIESQISFNLFMG